MTHEMYIGLNIITMNSASCTVPHT